MKSPKGETPSTGGSFDGTEEDYTYRSSGDCQMTHRRHAEIREKVMREFPPSPRDGATRVAAGHCIGHSPRQGGARIDVVLACQAQGIPNPNTMRDIEYGRDAQLSNVQAVAKALDCVWNWWKRFRPRKEFETQRTNAGITALPP